MKSFAVVLFCVAVAVVEAYPQFFERDSSNPSDDVEVVVSPFEGRRIELPSFDSDSSDSDVDFRSPFSTYDNTPFESFFKRLQGTLNALRDRMDTIMKRIPEASQNGTVFAFGDGPVQNKSTSTTKVVDGHVVTVNETTYSTGSNGNEAVFHFEIVEVKPDETDVQDRIPQESTEDTNVPETTDAPKSDEKTEDKPDEKTDDNNEIPKEKVSFPEWDSAETLSDPEPSQNEVDSEAIDKFDNELPVEVFHTYNKPKPERIHDLSGDTYVNQLLSDHADRQGLVMIDPDAELFEVNNPNEAMRDYFQYQPIRAEEAT